MNQLNKIISEVLNLDKKDNDKLKLEEGTEPNEIEAASGKVIIKETDIEGKSSKIVKIEEIKM